MNVSPIMSSPIGLTVPPVFPNGSQTRAGNVPSAVVTLSTAARALYSASNADSQTGTLSIAVSEAQTFANAFNGLLQYGSDLNAYYASGFSPGNLLAQALNGQQTGSGQSLMASLGSIGVEFRQPAADSPAGMTVDLGKLQTAYNSDPAGTLSLLSEANQSLAPIASEFSTNLAALSSIQPETASLNESTALTQSAVNNQNAVQILTSIVLNAAGQSNSLLPGVAALSPTQQLATMAASTQLSAAEQLAAVSQTTSVNAATAEATAQAAAVAEMTAVTQIAPPRLSATESTLQLAAALPAAASAAQSVATAAAGATAAPAGAVQTPLNTIDPFLVATSPFTAQAVAAYHMVDGIFDTGKGRPYSHSADPYWEYMPVEPSVAVREQLHR